MVLVLEAPSLNNKDVTNMCQAKPGLRCSAYLKKRKETVARVRAKAEGEGDVFEARLAEVRMRSLDDKYKSTATGLKEVKAEHGEDSGQYTYYSSVSDGSKVATGQVRDLDKIDFKGRELVADAALVDATDPEIITNLTHALVKQDALGLSELDRLARNPNTPMEAIALAANTVTDEEAWNDAVPGFIRHQNCPDSLKQEALEKKEYSALGAQWLSDSDGEMLANHATKHGSAPELRSIMLDIQSGGHYPPVVRAALYRGLEERMKSSTRTALNGVRDDIGYLASSDGMPESVTKAHIKNHGYDTHYARSTKNPKDINAILGDKSQYSAVKSELLRKNPNLTGAQLTKAWESDPDLRAEIASNPNAPSELLERAVRESPTTMAAASALEHPSVPRFILDNAVNGDNISAAQRVARNPALTKAQVEKLAEKGIAGAFSHPKLSRDTLKKGLIHANPEVRSIASLNRQWSAKERISALFIARNHPSA